MLFFLFSTEEHPDPIYSLDSLEPDKWYAVIYQYTLLSPFRFHEQKRFVLQPELALNADTEAGPSSTDNALIFLRFSSQNFYDHNGRANDNGLPSVTIERGENYSGYNILATVPAPCEHLDNNTEVWLDDSNPVSTLNTDLPSLLCSSSRHYSFCQKDLIKNVDVRCDEELCFYGDLLIDGEKYEIKQHCENVSLYYEEEPLQDDSAPVPRYISWFFCILFYCFQNQISTDLIVL